MARDSSGLEEELQQSQHWIEMTNYNPSSPLLGSNSDNDSDVFNSPPEKVTLMKGRATSPTLPAVHTGIRRRLTLAHFKHSYSLRSLFTVKPIEAFLESRDAKPDGGSLAEKLGLIDLLGYGVGCTVGAGIYSLIGIGAGIAGPGILISFLIGAIAAMFTALAYSEFAARVPITGSAYTYAYASFGELLAWVIGWNLTLEYCISSAAIARSWGNYFSYFWTQYGVDAPKWINEIDIGFTTLSPAAAFIVLFCTVIMLFGITASSTFNVIITIMNVGILLFFIGVGACEVYPDFWTYTHDSFVPNGAASLFSGAGTVFFSYLGFDMVSSLAEETQNPTKTLPRGIIGSLGIAAVIYVGVSLVATGLVPYQFMVNSKAPLAIALEMRGLGWAAKVVTCGSLLGLTATTFTGLLGQPRIFYTMARDGLFFPPFQWTSKKSEVPVVGTILTGIFTAIVAFAMTLEALADAISIGTLMAFSLVCAGVMVLRYTGGGKGLCSYLPIMLVIMFMCTTFISAMLFTHSDNLKSIPLVALSSIFGFISLVVFICLCFMKSHNIPESFKCPLVPFVPCMGIAINSYMLAGLKAAAWYRLAGWLFIGMTIYVLYGIWNSKMRTYRGIGGMKRKRLNIEASSVHVQEHIIQSGDKYE